MKSAAEITHQIHMLKREIATFTPSPKDIAKLAKLEAELPTAKLRENKRLVKTLTYKADIYHPRLGRIYSHQGSWTCDTAGLFFTKRECPSMHIAINPDELTDGNGQLITEDSTL